MTTNKNIVKITITFRNLEGTDAIRTYTNEKLTKCLEKFAQHNTEAHVVLQVEKNRQIAEVGLLANGTNIVAKEERDDLYAAVDALVDTLTHQLRKHKEKLIKRH